MTLIRRIVLALALLAVTFVAHGQPQGSMYVFNPSRDIGNIRTLTGATLQTLTSSDQTNTGYRTAICVLSVTSQTGTPSTTFSIQNKDAASGLYYSLITSAALTTATTSAIAAGPGVATVTNVGSSLPLAAKWRVSASTTGAASTITGTIGCSLQ